MNHFFINKILTLQCIKFYSSCTIILDNSNVFVITGLFKQNVVNIWMVSHMFHNIWYQKRSHTFIHTNNNIGNICLSFRGQSLTTTKTSMRKIKDERKQIFCWWPRFHGQCTEWRKTTPYFVQFSREYFLHVWHSPCQE